MVGNDSNNPSQYREVGWMSNFVTKSQRINAAMRKYLISAPDQIQAITEVCNFMGCCRGAVKNWRSGRDACRMQSRLLHAAAFLRHKGVLPAIELGQPPCPLRVLELEYGRRNVDMMELACELHRSKHEILDALMEKGADYGDLETRVAYWLKQRRLWPK
jgi:hypothetical protein